MKNLVCLVCALILGGQINIMFWNVENFFDYIDEAQSESDTEFSSYGERHWTKKRFKTKCNVIAKTVFWQAGRQGGAMPDIVAFAEVENRNVLDKLLDYTLLRKKGYKIIHYDSPDPRGIDVAMLYRPQSLLLVESAPVRIEGLQTRDILLASFVTPEGDSLAVMVNHHPSKYGGEEETQEKRQMALETLKHLSDSLAAVGWARRIAVGDFNEDASAPSFNLLEPELVNMGRNSSQGSIRFDGQWQLIDIAFVSKELFPYAEFEVLRVPFLTTRDSTHPGEKPLRTYSGPRYLGGASDHYPICISLKY